MLFFALTGIVQLFSLHEAHDGYTPPALIEKLSSVHQDQAFRLKEHEGPPPGANHSNDADHDKAASKAPPSAAQIRVWVLKWVFVLVGVGLIASTLIGLWMALTVGRRLTTVVLFVIGVAGPVLLLLSY